MMGFNRFICRQVIFIAAFLIISNYISGQDIKRPKIGLVLSGGGAKGFAHIGVLKILEEEGIPIDIIVGTSMGSIVGGLYSIGYNAAEIEQMAKTENWNLLLSDEISRAQSSHFLKDEQQKYFLSLPVNKRLEIEVPQAAIQGQNVLNLFCNLTGNVPVNADFNDFPIRFACIGTDVSTGKEVVLDKGFLPTALYSSMAIPGVFVPIEHNGHVMIDGGVVNNLPADVAKKMGADIIIGVDIRDDLHKTEEIKSIKELLDQLTNFYALGKDTINKSYCSVLIKPDISGYDASSFNTSAVDTLIIRGETATKALLPGIRKLKNDYNLKPKIISRQYVKNDKWAITKINISGNHTLNNKLILDNLRLEIPGLYSYNELKNAIDRVYGLSSTEKVFFNLTDNGAEGKTLNLNISEKQSATFNLGMRVNSTDAVSILVNYSKRDYNRYFSNLSLSANISSNPEINVYTEFSKGKLPIVGFQLTGKYREYKLYDKGQKINSSEIYYSSGSTYLYQPLNRDITIGCGLKFELFNGNFFNMSSDSLIVLPQATTTNTNLYVFCSKDNLDNYYFPTRGSEIYSEFSLVEDEKYKSLSPVLLVKSRNVIKLNKRLGLLANFHGRAIFSGAMPLIKQNFIGGHDYEIYFNNHLPFYGIPPIMLAERFVFIGLIGLKTNVYKEHYVSLMANGLIQSNQIKKLKDFKTEWGFGFDYAYNSIIGPIGFTIGYSGWYNKPVFSVNIGMWF